MANNNLLENVKINESRIVGNEIITKNIVISEKITILKDAELDGTFLKTFTEPLDEDTNEEIDLYEKIARIDTKISTHTLQHANNASAIATRYTKGQTDSMFAKNTDPYITGNIFIRDDMWSSFKTLDSILSTKVDDAQLGNFVTLEESYTALALKADISLLTNDYVTKNMPEFLLTEIYRYIEIRNKTSLEEYNASVNINLGGLSSTITFITNKISQNVNELTTVVSTKAEADQLTTLIEKPADYNGNLQSYIELKAPEQIPPDISGLVSKPGDYNGDLESYIQLKAPEPDLSAYSLTTDIDEELLLKADKTSLEEYNASVNMNLGGLSSTITFITNKISQNVNELTTVVSTKAEADQLTTLIEKPADYAGNNLETYIQLKAPEPDLSGYSLTTDINEKLLLKADNTSL